MSDFRRSKLNERYQNDSLFNSCVQTLRSMIGQNGLTPSELREACFLAHYLYEMENPVPTLRLEAERRESLLKQYGPVVREDSDAHKR